MDTSSIQEPLRGDNIELNGVVVSKSILFQNKQNSEFHTKLLKSVYHSQMSEQQRMALLADLYRDCPSDVLTPKASADNAFSCLPLVLPTDPKYITFKVVVTAFVYILFFSIPIDWAFGSDVWNTFPSWALIMSVAFIFIILFVDIILEFVTAYYKHGNLITKRTDIITNYLQGFFLYDLVAYLAFLIRFIAWTNRFRVFYLLFYIKWFSMGKIDQFFEEIILLHRKLRTAYSFCQIIVILQFAIVIFACGFYVIGEASYQAGLRSWLTEDSMFGKIQDRKIQDRLFYSFYFSLGTMTTTMGYGDIVPTNDFECAYCLVGIILAVIIFSLMINYLYEIIYEYKINMAQIYEKRVAINRFMRSKELPQALRERVRQYLNEHWAEEGTRNIELEQTILEELAPELRQEVMLNSYGILLLEIPLLHESFSLSFRKELALKVQEVSFASGEVVFQRFDELDDYSIYCIQMGSVSINHCSDQLSVLHKKDLFGEWSFITGMDRKASASAISYCCFYRVSREEFLKLLKDFTEDYEEFCNIKDKVLFENQIGILGQCWTCGSHQHYSTECPETHYVPNISEMLLLNNIARQQQRRKLQRYKRQHWKAIKSILQLQVHQNSRLSVSINQYNNPDHNLQLQDFDKPREFQQYFQGINIMNRSQVQLNTPLKVNKNHRKTISYTSWQN